MVCPAEYWVTSRRFSDRLNVFSNVMSSDVVSFEMIDAPDMEA